MNSIQFSEAVKAAFLARFPMGYVKVSRLTLGNGFCISAGLIANIEDQVSHIRDNDPLSVLMFLHDTAYNSDKEIDGKIEVEFGRSSLMVKPTNKLYAMDSHRIPVRKMNNTPEKVVQSLEKYFDKVLETVKEQAQANNIHGQDRIPEKYLNF